MGTPNQGVLNENTVGIRSPSGIFAEAVSRRMRHSSTARRGFIDSSWRYCMQHASYRFIYRLARSFLYLFNCLYLSVFTHVQFIDPPGNLHGNTLSTQRLSSCLWIKHSLQLAGQFSFSIEPAMCD